MTDEAFFKSVKLMREHQRSYFSAPRGSDEKQSALIASKVQEKLVDEEIERREEADRTPSLFDNAEVLDASPGGPVQREEFRARMAEEGRVAMSPFDTALYG